MAYKRKKKCTGGYKRVRLRRKTSTGKRYVLRCKGFGPKRKSSKRKSRKRTHRKHRGMAYKGSKCTGGFKRVRLRRKTSTGRRYVLRCKGFGPKRRRRRAA